MLQGLVLRRFHRVRRARWELFGAGLQRFLYFSDAAFQLCIVAIDYGRRVIFHNDVRVHAVAFNHVLTFRGGRGEFRHKYLPTVEKRPAPRDADNATPGALPNQRSEASLAKHVGKNVAVGGGCFIDQTYFWPVEDRARIGIRLLIDAVKIRSK